MGGEHGAKKPKDPGEDQAKTSRKRDATPLDESLAQFLADEVARSSYGYVADRIGISKGMVERIVKNKQSATLYTVSKIQLAYCVGIADLLELPREPPKLKEPGSG